MQITEYSLIALQILLKKPALVFLIFLIAKLNGENGYLKDIEAPIFFRVNLKTIKNYLTHLTQMRYFFVNLPTHS